MFSKMLKSLYKNLLYVFYLIIIIGVVLEILLRIFNPLPPRIVANKINLPKNQVYNLPNKNFTKIKHDGIHRKNSFGFRGEEWDGQKVKDKITILTVGGSTTECYFIDDNRTWANLLGKKLSQKYPNIINNAGLNGHSSVGHVVLLENYFPKIKPDYALILLGINDIANTENGGNKFDDNLNESQGFRHYVQKIEDYSRLINLLHSLYRSYEAYKFGLNDKNEWVLDKKYKPLLTSSLDTDKILNIHAKAQEIYKSRLIKILDLCKKNGTEPIFITQPLLFGYGKDSITNIDLGQYPIYAINGEMYWKKLQIYNQSLKIVAADNQVSVIDLAKELPKNSLYFYDDMHFSDKGCEKVSEILSNRFSEILRLKSKKALNN
jgi:lysophospholipase L1-like esterase